MKNKATITSSVNFLGRTITKKIPQTVKLGGQLMNTSKAIKLTANNIASRAIVRTTRTVGSLPAQMIPMGIGASVLIAVTAWDLNDTCETMKDLDALDKAIDPESKTDLEVDKVCGANIPTPEEVLEMAKESPQKAWEAAKPYVPDSETFSNINFDDIEWGNMWTNSLDAGSSLATGVKKGTGKPNQ